MSHRISRRFFFAFAAAAALHGASFAQPAWPSRPITLIVPYNAGGASDFGARLISSDLARRLGQPVIVENVAGAGGALGVQRLLRAEADGHTLLYGSLSETVMVPIVNAAAARYRSQDLLPVALTGKTPVAFVTRPDFPASTMDELVAMLGKRPGGLTYGSPGVGTFQHVMAETVKARTGTFMVHIPYRGGSNIVNDVVSGQIDIGVTTAPNVAPLVGAGRIKALGVSSRERIPALKDTQSFGETESLKALDLQTWGMVFARTGTPDAVVRRLNAAINEVLMQPKTQATLQKAGATLARPLSVEEAKAFFLTESEAYRPIAERIKPE